MDLKSLIAARLNDHLDELRSFVDGLTEEQLSDRRSNGHRSLSDIVHHLADVQDAYIDIVAHILLQDLPTVVPPPLENGVFPSEPNLSARLDEFTRHRRNLVSLLAALSDHHWRREGHHPVIPHYTLEKCLEEMMRHEESHFFEMYHIFFGIDDLQ